MIGEIYIGGIGVAKGYINDEEKTSNSFVKSKYGRLYRTGDFGKYSREGYVIFCGRRDSQVKIGGYRIELEEIEAQIKEVPNIKDCIAVVNYKNQIVVFYKGEELDIAEIKRAIRKKLPTYMYPHRYYRVDDFPLNTNEKIDRKMLKSMADSGIQNKMHNEKQDDLRNPSLNKVIEIWSEVLNCDVEPENDFFELGGDSIKAQRIVRKIADNFKVKISFLTVIHSKNVAEFSKEVEKISLSFKNSKKDEATSAGSKQDNQNVFPLTGVQLAYLNGRNDNYELGKYNAHYYFEAETEYTANQIEYINTVYSNSLASEIKKTERYIKRQENVASKMQQQILNIRCSQELLSKLNFSLKCKKEYHPLLLEELLDLRTESEIENIFDNFSQEYIQYSVEMRKKILAQTILFYMNKKGVLLKDIPCTLNQILKCLSVNTDNNDIIYRWIELLKKYNYVTETDGIYVCKIEIYEKGLKYGWEEVEYLWKGKLESPLVLDYIINNIKNWDKLIQKEQQATLLLFEQGEDIYADALYKETKILQYLNHSLSKKVLGYLYENANATILEIGAGTGATSDKVLSDIRENKFEEHIVYFYTDISRFFLQRAKERYKECDGKIEMHYQTLDIDEAFSSQLPSNFQADIVIAVGVLNNSVNTDKCIYEINSVMKPGGILLIIETVEDVPDILITQSFMMTEPKDQRKATNTMFLNRKQWLEILEENGFCNSEEFPGYGEYLEVLGQKLFYCTKE